MSLKYRLDILGWYNFERLIHGLLKAIIGPGVTTFGGTKDGGRDAAFEGEANFPSTKTKWNGRWVFQVKHIDVELAGAKSARKRLLIEFKNEIKKIFSRRKKTKIQNYILITNVPLTATNRSGLSDLVYQVANSVRFKAIDGREVCEFLDLQPSLRRSFPQLLGLADIDHVVNREMYERSQAFISQWQQRLRAFVRTEIYEEALRVLGRRNFLVLDGPPEAGKTTIAAALSILFASEGYEIVDVRGPEHVFQTFDKSKKQFFVADDAVGSVAFDPGLTDRWSRDLPGVITKLDQEHFLVWTSRHYILEEAISESRLSEAAKDFPHVNEVLVEVGKLSQMERAEILYMHAKFASLNFAARKIIKGNARIISQHQNFTPLRIQQLFDTIIPELSLETGDEQETNAKHDILEFLDDPGSRWKAAYRKLREPDQVLLASLLENDGWATPEVIKSTFERRCAALEITMAPFGESLSRLKHSFVQVTESFLGGEYMTFQHPSLRDLLLNELNEDSVSRKKYIELISAGGLAHLIRDFSIAQSETESTKHILRIEEPDELQTLVSRIETLKQVTMTPIQWADLFQSLLSLIPKDQDGVRITAYENLKNFRGSTSEKLVCSVIDAFRSKGTFESNRRYSVHNWTQLIREYTKLQRYKRGDSRIIYLPELAKIIIQKKDLSTIALINSIRNIEETFVSTYLSRKLLGELDEQLQQELYSTKEEGEKFEYLEDDFAEWEAEDFSSWSDDANDLTQTANEFYLWSGITVSNELTSLEDLIDRLAPPPEPDYGENYRSKSTGDDYWTIERLFEDL